MTEQTAPATETVEKKRSTWKPLAAAGIGGAVLVATGFGIFAQLNATAFNATPQQLDSGTLRLALNPDATGLSQASFTSELTKLAPQDSVQRLVTLKSGGTLDGVSPTLKVVDGYTPAGSSTAAPTLLTTDTNRGLQATISRCASAWTFTNGATAPSCSGTTTTVLSASLATLTDATPDALAGLDTTAGAVNYLLVNVTLPNDVETSTNGGPGVPAAGTGTGSIQGLTAQLTWTFSDVQRGAKIDAAAS